MVYIEGERAGSLVQGRHLARVTQQVDDYMVVEMILAGVDWAAFGLCTFN